MKIGMFLLGTLFLAIGAIGVVLPILPTTPFLLLAGYFYSKSSSRVQEWFHQTTLYQRHLKEFSENKTLPLSRKIILTTFASSMLIMGWFLTDHLVVKIVLIMSFIVLHFYFWVVIKTRKDHE
ncbi:MAG: YbaN family protein [bacterium]|nr:YbaN family protein [bacterium]